jgi:predicted lipoprotein with Yx(FWY)xxD motif
MKSLSLGTALLAALLALPALAADPPVKKADGVLVDSSGKTVYTFDKDTANSGKSACTGSCAENWPPVTVIVPDTAQGPYSTITREDGSKQLTYKGKPLYTFKKDKKAGDKTGDKAMNAWHVVTD